MLLRIAHGIYLYPKTDMELGILYPPIDEIAKAIAKRDKARIIPTGIQALNLLGLSTSGAYEGGLSYRWCTAEYLHARLAPAWISKIMISTFEM